MDGLEFKEILLSFLLNENAEGRIDSEYVLKEYLEYDARISSMRFERIGFFADVTDGIHTSIEFDDESDINLISAKAPKNNVFDLQSTGYISKKQDNINPRTRLKVNDIIISTVGTIGNCAVVNEDILPANSDRHVGIIRLHQNSEFLPRYVSTFLLSKYGRFQTKRHTTGNVQPNLFIYKIKELKIPKLSNTFQRTIENIILHADELRRNADLLYNNAEQILCEELNLSRLVLPNEKYSERSCSESFIAYGRLDAEYYQKKHDIYYDLITTYSNGYELVGNICTIKDSNYIPLADRSYSYIELSNIGTYGNVMNPNIDLGINLPSRARRIVTTGDVIVSSVEGSLSKCALIESEYNNSICSNGFYVISCKLINTETLLVLFKNKVIQELMKRGCSGTILMAISKDEFKKIPLPIVKESIQNQIKHLIKQAVKLRHDSISFINKAEKMVEIAIEGGESNALQYYKSNNKSE